MAVAASQRIKNALAPTLSWGKLTIRSVWVSVTSGASDIKYIMIFAFSYKEFFVILVACLNIFPVIQ